MAQIISMSQSVSVKEARSIISRFRRTGEVSPQDVKAVEAAIFGYKKVRYTNDWGVTLRRPAREIMQNAAHLARTEGMVNHALSLDARLLRLPKNSRYRAGRLKNGCAYAQVLVPR